LKRGVSLRFAFLLLQFMTIPATARFFVCENIRLQNLRFALNPYRVLILRFDFSCMHTQERAASRLAKVRDAIQPDSLNVEFDQTSNAEQRHSSPPSQSSPATEATETSGARESYLSSDAKPPAPPHLPPPIIMARKENVRAQRSAAPPPRAAADKTVCGGQEHCLSDSGHLSPPPLPRSSCPLFLRSFILFFLMCSYVLVCHSCVFVGIKHLFAFRVRVHSLRTQGHRRILPSVLMDTFQ